MEEKKEKRNGDWGERERNSVGKNRGGKRIEEKNKRKKWCRHVIVHLGKLILETVYKTSLVIV